GVADVLVAEELRPGAVRRVGEVLDRPLPRAVPPSGGLPGTLPQEGMAPVGVAEPDHVAKPSTSDRASCRTFRASSLSGSHLSRSTWAGDRPSSWGRGRSNHRRIPMSLYEPRRSPTI